MIFSNSYSFTFASSWCSSLANTSKYLLFSICSFCNYANELALEIATASVRVGASSLFIKLVIWIKRRSNFSMVSNWWMTLSCKQISLLSFSMLLCTLFLLTYSFDSTFAFVGCVLNPHLIALSCTSINVSLDSSMLSIISPNLVTHWLIVLRLRLNSFKVGWSFNMTFEIRSWSTWCYCYRDS